jgi:outer membrane protein assembly factor BamB
MNTTSINAHALRLWPGVLFVTLQWLSDIHWRWTETPEERLLARGEEPVVPVAVKPLETRVDAKVEDKKEVPTAATEKASVFAPDVSKPEWPGFRGPKRDSIVRGVRIETNWSASPPLELWRRPIGPGWSSFAVHGNLIYTQEQRGEDEVVSCYSLTTGEPVWRHKDRVRFWESNGGAGPRGTPALSGNRVYTFGATGVLNALDRATGSLIWSRNAATDTGKEIPDWGIASSPLVIDDVVILGVAGQLAGYDAATGKLRWTGPTGGGGYSSPHLATIGASFKFC